MVKKNSSILVIAFMMLAISCSSEKFDVVQKSNEATVSLTAQIPNGIQSRTRAEYGDGTTVSTLSYAVYLIDGDTWNLTNISADDLPINMSETVSLRLVNGNTYKIVFWADAAESKYTFDKENINVTANYEGVNSNDETLDAFYAVEEIVVNGAVSKNVELKRPFAQLNIGTSDLDEANNAGRAVTKAGIKVKTYNTLNFKDSSVSGENDVTFAIADFTTGSYTFPVSGHNYLTMNYLLMPEDKKADNIITISYDNANVPARTFQNVPLQRNYRTNIYGKLITSAENINVRIEPGFKSESHAREYWDGKTITPVAEVNGVYEVLKASQLAWISQETANGVNFSGKTVKLSADIYLNEQPWSPIGNFSKNKPFNGIFDGQNYTIYGLNVTDKASAGLFGTLYLGKAINVKIDGATINSNHYAGAIAGFSYGYIENCEVSNATLTSSTELTSDGWDNGDKVGGILGYYGEGNRTIKGCTVTNVTIKGYRDLGGIVGFANKETSVCDNTINNVTIIVDANHNYKNYTQPAQYDANDIVGEKGENVTINNNQGTANISRPEAVAQIVTVEELQNMLTTFTASGSGDRTINIESDLILAENENWTPVDVQGYTGAGVITLNGNGHYISGLNAPLFDGGFAGQSGIIINDLTIKNSEMDVTNKFSATGAGIFIADIQAMQKIEITNCHVLNSRLLDSASDDNLSRNGGIIGYISGYSGADGPVKTYVNIKNCSVIGSTIEGASVGGIVGHCGGDKFTYVTITQCKVKDCTLSSKKNGSWRVGVVAGTVGAGEKNDFSYITESGNILQQTGQTAPTDQSKLYGRFVPAGTGTLTIDNVQIQ